MLTCFLIVGFGWPFKAIFPHDKLVFLKQFKEKDFRVNQHLNDAFSMNKSVLHRK